MTVWSASPEGALARLHEGFLNHQKQLLETLDQATARHEEWARSRGFRRWLEMNLAPSLRKFGHRELPVLRALGVSCRADIESLAAFEADSLRRLDCRPSPTEPARILVDLRPIREDGTNGGLQTYVTWLISWLRAKYRESFRFLALAESSNRSYIGGLLDERDAVVVPGLTDQVFEPTSDGCPLIAGCSLSVVKLVRHLGISAFYAPLGTLPSPDPGVPGIALLVDLLHREHPEFLPEEQRMVRDHWFGDTARRATRIQCISRSVQELLERHFPAAAGKTFVTYLPVQRRLAEAAQPELSTRPSLPCLPEGQPYFFYPANFWPHKNHAGLVKGYSLYASRAVAEPWHLVLTGADSVGGQQAVADLVRALGQESRIHLLSYVGDSDLHRIWLHAGALVFPSFHEGFGIPLLEAMHYGVPIVSAPSYSLREIADDAALYFDPASPEDIASKLGQIAEDAALRRTLVQLGEERLRRFDPETEASVFARHLLETARGYQESVSHPA